MAAKSHHVVLVALERLGHLPSRSFTYLREVLACFREQLLRALHAFVELFLGFDSLLIDQLGHIVASLANFHEKALHSFATRAHGYSFRLCNGQWFGLGVWFG